MSEEAADLIDYVYQSTDRQNSNWNEAFRLNFMSFNPYGCQLVARYKLYDNLINLVLEDQEKWDDTDDLKFIQFLQGISNKSKNVLFAAGSIDGKTLDTFLTRKQKAILVSNSDDHNSFRIFGSNNNNQQRQ